MRNGDELLSVRMTVRSWVCIDGTLDNVISDAVVDGPEEDVTLANAIREAGNPQVPWVDGRRPPGESVVSVSLTRDEWAFALRHVAADVVVYEDLGDEFVDSVEACKEVVAALRGAGI